MRIIRLNLGKFVAKNNIFIQKTKCFSTSRNFSSEKSVPIGYVLGVYTKEGKFEISEAAEVIDANSSGKLSSLLNIGTPLETGKSRVLYGLSDKFPIVSVVGLGEKNLTSRPLEERDETKEAVRTAVAAGCLSLKDLKLATIKVDPCGDGCSAGEGAALSLFTYQDLKLKKKDVPRLECIEKQNSDWTKGLTLAEGQNIARRLMEMPGNILTPTNFAQEAINCLEGLDVEVNVRTQKWAKERKMNAFLSVSKGSIEPPIFLELNYKGSKNQSQAPLAIVGKGITFDAGGISLKSPIGMDLMRGDMGGAACTVGSIFAAAVLKMPINVKGFIPLCENLPSGAANKPGDVVIASNGKSIQINDTDFEGRLILADALHHASSHNPRAIIDMATLTADMIAALGAGAAGAYTNYVPLFDLMHKAGQETGDRVWRMPLFEMYYTQVKDFGMADVHNMGKHSKMAGASLAAAFLQEFVTCDRWIHLDIAGVMANTDEVPYLGNGMSGRPTRTIAKFIEYLSSTDKL